MTYTGGYYSIPTHLVKTGLHRHTADLKEPAPALVLSAVNHVQRVPWRVNKFILQVMRDARSAGETIAGLPSADDKPLPPKVPDALWAAMSPAEKLAHKIDIARQHGYNARLKGKREDLGRLLDIADEVKDKPRIYFPHALDFRGRIYPIPQDLNPQGDDGTKALLEFARGQQIRTDPHRGWLEIALANAAGQDKMTFDERRAWVSDNSTMICDSAAAPLDGHRMWVEMDSPWMFLALAREYAAHNRNAALEQHVPCHIDATCSGMQHLSAMGLDPIGGRATNLLNTGRREDLYSEVAAAAAAIVSREAIKGNPEAQAWAGRVGRSVVKRAVMTTPYGVTPRGIRDQLIGDRHVDGVDGKAVDNAAFMTRVIVEAMESTVVSAKQIMAWIQDCASSLAHADQPLMWTTPSGFTVKQSYYKLRDQRVRTLAGEICLAQESPEMGLDLHKMSNSAAPNVVHSFDAAHLGLVTDELFRRGVDDIAVIHDSYGTHACNVNVVGAVLREKFVEMYDGDRLEQFEAGIKEYAPDVPLPPRPERGTLDLQGVLASPYFFS